MGKVLSSKEKIAYAIATSLYIGNTPKAPGTWGSIPGLVLGYILFQYWDNSFLGILAKLIILLILSSIALWSIKVTEKSVLKHDDKSIVIDEVIGQAIVTSFIIPSFYGYIIAFLLFRLFDIVKIGPVGWADKKIHSHWGTFLDDVIAGFFALIVYYIIF